MNVMVNTATRSFRRKWWIEGDKFTDGPARVRDVGIRLLQFGTGRNEGRSASMSPEVDQYRIVEASTMRLVLVDTDDESGDHLLRDRIPE